VTPWEVVRDPLWNNIRLDHAALAVVDTPAFQRLRYIRQLGHAFLVYPGATHTRFEHALGAYHLARRVLAQLDDVLGRAAVSPEAALHLRTAALLHDIGHYPFSHALEEAGLPHHEELAARHLATEELAGSLARMGVSADDLLPLIRGAGRAPLSGIISGSLDVDKLDYLSRDALACGVPYGLIDVDRLLASLTTVAAGDLATLALTEKGLAPLESLLFAKYQMYRNVYWHHAVRAATVMFKRLVRRALAEAQVGADAVALGTDDGLIHDLQQHDESGLARALRERRLAKRVLDLHATALPVTPAEWPARMPDLLEQVEDRAAREVGLSPGELFFDFPAKPGMLDIEIPLVRRDGSVVPLSDAAASPHLGLPHVAAELYRAARRLRVFALRPARVDADAVAGLLEMSGDEVRARLAAGRALLRTAGARSGG